MFNHGTLTTYRYGFPNQRLLENLNCGLIQDFLTHMQSNDSTDKMVRIFVNTVEIQPLLVLLGAFKYVLIYLLIVGC